jgi:hypothetical protein
MATPSWIAATPGFAPLASEVNQLLATHAFNCVYTGTLLGSSTTLSGSATNTNGLYIAQSFTPGAQTAQRWIFTLAVTGTPTALTLSIQTDNAGAPSGTALSTTVIPALFVPGAAGQVSVPTAPVTFAAATQYWAVFNAVGDVSNFYSVSRTTAASGVSTSPNGTAWTGQAYGMYYQRFDNSVTGSLLHTYEDSGARWTSLAWNATNTPSTVQEYTVAQGANQSFASSRAFSYTNGLISSIA